MKTLVKMVRRLPSIAEHHHWEAGLGSMGKAGRGRKRRRNNRRSKSMLYGSRIIIGGADQVAIGCVGSQLSLVTSDSKQRKVSNSSFEDATLVIL